jgi:hypothetical protein
MGPKRFTSSIVYWPIALTALLLCWTALVSPYSKYGDNWAIVPAILALPLVIATHIALLMREGWRAQFIAYGVLHTGLFFILWIWCLMHISKDAL